MKSAQVETVLLLFKGKIIYDGFIGTLPIGYAEGAEAVLVRRMPKQQKRGMKR